MKRTPLQRTPLQRTKPLTRKKAMPRVNRARLMRRRAKQFGDQAELCRYMQCCVCRRYSTEPRARQACDLDTAIAAAIEWRERYGKDARVSDPHHVKTRGAGGTDEHCVPLCRKCHDEAGRVGATTFETRHNINLRNFAAALHERITQRNE